MVTKDALLQARNVVIVFLLLIPVLYFSTTQSLYNLWIKSGNPAYSHGAIAVLIAAYIFLKYWFADKAAPQTPRFYVLGTLVLIVCSMLWFLAALGGIQILQQLLFIGLVAALFWSLFGIATVKNLAIPLLVVLTAIPVWDFLNLYLQIATAVSVEVMLNVSGIPFVREGTNILLPNGTFQIEERCSGLRMFVAMVAIALLCIYQWRLRFSIAVGFMLVSLLLAIVINSIRIYIVVIAGYLTDMQHYFVTTDHVTLGWILFGVVLFLYLMLCNKYLLSDRWYAKITTSISGAVQDQSDDSDTTHAVNKTSSNIVNKGSFISTLVVTLVALSIGPVLTGFYQNYPDEVISVTIELDGQINEWAAQERDMGDWQPVYNGADYEGKKVYQNSIGDVVELYLAHYAFQAEGKEAIHYSNKSYDEDSWKTVSRRRLDQTLTNVSLAVDQRIVESSRGKKKLLWQWYYVNKRRLSGGVDAKLAGIQGILSGDPQITVLIATVDMGQSYEQARAVLTSFLTESIDTIESAIDHVRLVEHADH